MRPNKPFIASFQVMQVLFQKSLGRLLRIHYWKKNDKSKEPQCTPEKEEAIRDAFKNFNII